jgi:hypothetical protein
MLLPSSRARSGISLLSSATTAFGHIRRAPSTMLRMVPLPVPGRSYGLPVIPDLIRDLPSSFDNRRHEEGRSRVEPGMTKEAAD